MSTATGHRVYRMRLPAALLAGGLAGAVAGPSFELLVAGWTGGGLLVIAAMLGGLIGGTAGLVAAAILNVALVRTDRSMAPVSASLALAAAAFTVVAVPHWALGDTPLTATGSLLTALAMLAAVPAAVVVTRRSRKLVP